MSSDCCTVPSCFCVLFRWAQELFPGLFDRCKVYLDSFATEASVKFQNDTIMLKTLSRGFDTFTVHYKTSDIQRFIIYIPDGMFS